MKQIKLSGREIAVLRAIDFSLGTRGDEVIERSRIDPDELVDVLNGLLDVGYIECTPIQEDITLLTIKSTEFEVNPSYALTLREVIFKRG
jgi:DNA-binding MarR family transcriptional regulator